jgi:hypothetical protein
MFEKKVSEGRSVVLDFHAPSPAEKRNDLRVESRRVKPQPSLGQTGIHGRVNPEAASSELHPFSFTCAGVEIVLPNPVTLAWPSASAVQSVFAVRSRGQWTGRGATFRQKFSLVGQRVSNQPCYPVGESKGEP